MKKRRNKNAAEQLQQVQIRMIERIIAGKKNTIPRKKKYDELKKKTEG